MTESPMHDEIDRLKGLVDHYRALSDRRAHEVKAWMDAYNRMADDVVTLRVQLADAERRAGEAETDRIKQQLGRLA